MFIVIEGIDGSGKGTQAKRIISELKKSGKKVLELDYPRYGEGSSYFIKKYLNGEYGNQVSSELASMFFALDRFDDLRDKKESFSEYDYVVSNRYTSSNMLHQASKIEDREKRHIFLDWLQDLEYRICGIPKPDKVLFLDVSPNIAKELISLKEARSYIKTGGKDILESDDDYLETSYKLGLEMVQKYSEWQKIDCIMDNSILSEDIITQMILTHLH